MSSVLLGSLEVISLRLSLPLVGIWTANVELDGDKPPTGAQALLMAVEGAAPVVFSGTVLESGTFEGRSRAFLVGGSAGLRRKLPPRQYSIAPPRVLVSAILREANEMPGDLSGLEGLPPLPRWIRSAGSGASALSLICRRLGLGWRVARNGSIHVGPEGWPEFSGRVSLVEENGSNGRALAAHDKPDLEPGILLEGRRVGRVVHIVREGGVFRSEVHFEAAS